MAGGLAIIAGRGDLPRLIADAALGKGEAYLVCHFPGEPIAWATEHPNYFGPFEKAGALFRAIHDAGCDRVIFAGGMDRPKLNPLRFDGKFLKLSAKLLPALNAGDDETLRVIASVFEGEGLTLVPAQDYLEELKTPNKVLGKLVPTQEERKDIIRAARIVAALGDVDVGQAAVVADGICLGAEAIGGTDYLLSNVAGLPVGKRKGAKGVLFKGPKPDQDTRMDLPTIGPDTIENAAKAGLSGVAVAAGASLILNQEATIAKADALGLFVMGWAP